MKISVAITPIHLGVVFWIACCDVVSGREHGITRNMRYDTDPIHDNVESPPAAPYTNAPSVSPSELKCATDENGFYGTESAHTVSVSFTYELEFSDSSGLDEVLPSLERAFADALLPVFFSSGDCAQVGVAVHDNASLVLGISTKPDDTVLDDVICNATTANNTCEILSGELFIFVADSGMESSIEDAAITTLKSGSENDDFLDAHVAINRVTFVDLETEGPIIGDPDPITGAPLGGDPRLVTFVIVGIVAGIAALFLILALLARKKRSDDNEEESSAGNSA